MSTKRKSELPCGRPLPAKVPSKETDFGRWEEQLRRYLGAQGLKSSSQRWSIVKLILSEKGHFTTQAIVQKVQSESPGIGAATVYRNIKLLLEAGILIETLVDTQGRTFYEIADDDHHDHIVCLDCGYIFEFHDESIESSQVQVTKKLKFTQVRHRHVIYANCQYR